MDLEVKDLIQQANKGGDMSNIKSAASGKHDLQPSFASAPFLFDEREEPAMII